ncbi:MAG: hypothetical protein RSJ41_10030 [Clostridia bacterium]
MDFLSGLFSSSPGDMSRISLPGLIITVLGVLLYLIGPRLTPAHKLPIRFAALAVTLVGALMTMKFF